MHCTKIKFSYEDFLSKGEETADLVTFTGEILNEKLHFLCDDISRVFLVSLLNVLTAAFLYKKVIHIKCNIKKTERLLPMVSKFHVDNSGSSYIHII